MPSWVDELSDELVSMKRSKEERKEETAMASPMESDELYDYGLRLHFDEESLKKLKLSGLPKYDAELSIKARARVTDAGSDETADGERRHLTLQITDMALGDA